MSNLTIKAARRFPDGTAMRQTEEELLGIPVFVYYNLHRKVWSVKALGGPLKGKVVQHRIFIVLRDCTFKVSEAGRQRVLSTGKKNVHAGVVGYFMDGYERSRFVLDQSKDCEAFYNPRKFSSFVDGNKDPVYRAGYVVMNAYADEARVMVTGPVYSRPLP